MIKKNSSAGTSKKTELNKATIFVGGINPISSYKQIKLQFAQFGKVKRVIKVKGSRGALRHCFVIFDDPLSAKRALDFPGSIEINGRVVSCRPKLKGKGFKSLKTSLDFQKNILIENFIFDLPSRFKSAIGRVLALYGRIQRFYFVSPSKLEESSISPETRLVVCFDRAEEKDEFIGNIGLVQKAMDQFLDHKNSKSRCLEDESKNDGRSQLHYQAGLGIYRFKNRDFFQNKLKFYYAERSIVADLWSQRNKNELVIGLCKKLRHSNDNIRMGKASLG